MPAVCTTGEVGTKAAAKLFVNHIHHNHLNRRFQCAPLTALKKQSGEDQVNTGDAKDAKGNGKGAPHADIPPPHAAESSGIT